MNVLWLTTDRRHRVAQLFTPLQDAFFGVPGVGGSRVCGSVWYRADYWTKEPDPLPTVAHANSFDVVITDAVFAYRNQVWWRKIDTFKVVIIEDTHGLEVRDYVQFCLSTGFDLYLARYRAAFVEHHPGIYAGQVKWLPHSVDPRTFQDYGLKKEVGVLMTGSVGKKNYPMRWHVVGALEGKPYFMQVRRPLERDLKDRWPSGETYARLINKSQLAVAGASRFQYVVAKYLEIPACRTALYAEPTPEFAAMGFEPYRHYIPIEEGRVDQQVLAWMDQPGELDRVTDAGYQLVHSAHTVKIRAGELVEIVAKQLKSNLTQREAV